MFLDILLGKKGSIRAYLLLIMILCTLLTVFAIVQTIYDLTAGGNFVPALKSSIWFMFNVLMTAALLMTWLSGALFRYKRYKASQIFSGLSSLPQNDTEDEPLRYEWNYMLAYGYDQSGQDMGTHRQTEVVTEEEIWASLRFLAAQPDVPSAHWDLLLAQPAVKKIGPKMRLYCLEERGKCQKRDRRQSAPDPAARPRSTSPLSLKV